MLNPNYVIGLIDGEGSFTIYVRNPESTKIVKRRVVVEPRFYVKLIERDKDILYQLQHFFGCGNIYLQKDRRRNHQDCYRYEVTKRDDLMMIIIPFFQKHKLLFQSKKYDFDIFCQLIKKINNNEHLTKKGLKEIYRIKQQMH